MSAVRGTYNINKGGNCMFKCKLCTALVQDEDMSTGHKKMCKLCYNLLDGYKRRMGDEGLSKEQQEKNELVEQMIESNRAAGGYVPKFMRDSEKTCVDCKCRYSSAYGTKCDDCERRYRNYMALRARGLRTKTVTAIEDHYWENIRLGRWVPNVFKEKGPL